MTSHQHHQQHHRQLLSTVALMLSYGVTPAQCFQQVNGLSIAERPSATRRFFRNHAGEGVTASHLEGLLQNTASVQQAQVDVLAQDYMHSPPQQEYNDHSYQQHLEHSFAAQSQATQEQPQDYTYSEQPTYNNNHEYTTEQYPQHHDTPHTTIHYNHHDATTSTTDYHDSTSTNTLPTWLSDSKDALWETAWYQLEDAMLHQSFFSKDETGRLLEAITTAAQGDRHQMANAAEFCLILVETMEMGLTALMAAAYHVCACVTARQQGAYAGSISSYTHHCLEDNTGTISAENHHITLIAKDAGRLKTLEMVAAMIYSDKAASRVTPDAQDAENLRSLLLTETKDWRALAIRSAAALFRLKGILRHAQKNTATGVGSREIRHVTPEALQCSREALYIYAPLASRLGMHRLKNELEGAAFRILYRRQYEKVNRLARAWRPRHSKPHLNRGLVEMCDHTLDISSCMKNVLEAVKADMTALLSQDAHFAEYVQDFSVTARVKEPYSLWKKMLRNKCTNIREVPDAIALRIVLEAKPLADVNDASKLEDENVKRARERALCYYAQQLCREHWQPLATDPRFKDYIESPKANGYQSLHYTAHTMWDEEDWTLEIQVRSQEMHQVAEFGLASHWDYKQQQTLQYSPEHQVVHPTTTEHDFSVYHQDQSSDGYLQSVQEWHWQNQQTAGQQQQQQQWDTSTESEERANRIRARTKKLQPYIDALTAAQSDLARDHVFIFLTTLEGGTGSVLALPAGACVLDALREGEKEWGFPFHDQVQLNGELLDKVTGRLQNGDILTVPVTATAMA